MKASVSAQAVLPFAITPTCQAVQFNVMTIYVLTELFGI